MKELLERWAELEPDKCKVEIRPNEEAFYIAAEAGNEGEVGYSRGWQRVLDTRGGYYPWKSQAFMEIQWAVQEAIVARGWGFELTYFNILDSYNAEIDIDEHISFNRPGKTAAEALLTVYLRALEALR